ncbi:MAG: hypothetical protein ACOX60_11865 [Massiliimalia sp.]
MQKLDLESFEFFAFGNISSGSDGGFNFKVFPSKEDMTVKIWYGSLCIDKSEIAAEQTFPLTEEGYEQLCQWVTQQQQQFHNH